MNGSGKGNRDKRPPDEENQGAFLFIKKNLYRCLSDAARNRDRLCGGSSLETSADMLLSFLQNWLCLFLAQDRRRKGSKAGWIKYFSNGFCKSSASPYGSGRIPLDRLPQTIFFFPGKNKKEEPPECGFRGFRALRGTVNEEE